MTIYKIAQVSDQHQGYKTGTFKHPLTGRNLREQDGYDAHEEVISQIIDYKDREGLDAVIGSGDIFHSPEPSVYTIVQVQKQLKRLYKNNIPFYNIAGNHDSTDSVREVPSNTVLDFPELNIFSYFSPYVKNEILPGIVCHFVSHHRFVEQSATFEDVNPEKGKFNILVTHGSVYDSALNEVLHTENEPREVVISEELMSKDWDYTIMGHIHERGWVHSKDRKTDTAGRKQFYGGSLIRRGFADKECKLGRGWTLWTIDTDKHTMMPEFFNISQRTQLDILILCENKSVDEITSNVKQEFDKIDFDKAPIVRVTFVGMTKIQENQMDWKRLLEPTKKCLTFNKRIRTKEEIKAEIKNSNFSFDLLKAYREFWESLKDEYPNELKDRVKGTTEDLLKKGQDKVIS